MLRWRSGTLQPVVGKSHGKSHSFMRVTVIAASIALSVVVSGCAEKQAPVVMVKQDHIVPSLARVAGRTYYLEIEDDGLEAQHPPLVAEKVEADDPTEPFSPNYGRL